MSTLQQRQKWVEEILKDPDLNLTVTEALRHVYQWVQLERAISKHKKWAKKEVKYRQLLQDDLEIFRLRKDMTSI